MSERAHRGFPVPPPALALALALVQAGLSLLFPSWAWTGPLVWAGAILGFMLGAALVVGGAGLFRRSGTSIDPVRLDRAKRLVTHGVFRWSRNPMYVGFTVLLVGWAFAWGGSLWLLGPLVFVALIDRLQIPAEERFLAATFGRDYEDYKSRVRRWL